MARPIEFLRKPLTPGPELDPLDPRLAAIADAIERRQFREAADQAEGLFAQNAYDVHAVSAYLYQAFAEGGIGVLGEIFATVTALVSENLGALSPARRREERLDRRLGWLFDAVDDALEYHALKGTTEWARWREGVGSDAFDAVLAQGDALGERQRALGFRVGDGGLGRLLTRLRALGPALATPPPEAYPKGKTEAPPSLAQPPFAAGSLEPSRHRVELVASDRFVELLCKLKAFEDLVEQKNYQKAALVGDDLLRTLDDFDPRAYFPELFAAFSALMSNHVGQLSPHWGDRESVAWKALTQFYRVDLKGFVGA